MLVFIDQVLRGVNENDHTGEFDVALHLISYHEVIQVNLGLVNISIDNALINNPLIRLRNNSDQIVKEDDDHEHCLKDPYEPDIGSNCILLILGDFIVLELLYPPFIYRSMHVSYRITKTVQEISKIFVQPLILVVIYLRDHECYRKECRVQEEKYYEWSQLRNSNSNHSNQEAKII